MVSFKCPALCKTHSAGCLTSSKGLKKKNKTLAGGLRSHSSQGTLISGKARLGLCARAAPPRPPPLLPQPQLLQGPQGHLLLLRKTGYSEPYRRRARRPRRCPPRGGGGVPGKRALSRGSCGHPQRPQRPERFVSRAPLGALLRLTWVPWDQVLSAPG